ncbi:MAG: T9SS type A sorting domain-containing protein, partial [Bacteroidia bacterium]
SSSGPPTIPYASKQLIDQTYYGPPQSMAAIPGGAHEWQFISVTFTANYNYSQLWLYPENPYGPPPPGNAQWNTTYIVEVDDIRVMKESPYTLSVSASKDTITGCKDSTQITILGMPTGTVASWKPAVNPANPTGNLVTAKPCSTTTYEILVYDSASNCANCIREVLYYTIHVNQWSDPTRIKYPGMVPCTDTIFLEYDTSQHIPSCLAVDDNTDYTWIDPQNNSYSGRMFTVLNANAFQTGEWTLLIHNKEKGCDEEHKFFITVGTCCMSNPRFTFNGCNPVQFTNISNGITNHVSTMWNFGDGSSSSLFSPIHTYNVSTATPFTVCLTMLYTDGQGESCCSRMCTTVVACPDTNACLVISDFTNSHVWGSEFDFTDASSGNGTICDYEWDFNGIKINTTLPTIRYNFPTPGPWFVCLRVINCLYDAAGNEIGRCTSQKCMWIYPMEGKRNPGDPPQEIQPRTDPGLSGEPSVNSGLTIYPNPNTGSFALSLNRTGSFKVVIRDNLGREVYSREHVFGNSPVQITLNDLSDGIYAVEVTDNREKFVQQITISR